jgi:CHAD domain-containing protein
MSKPGKVAWNRRNGAAPNARRQLPRLVQNYFAEVRHALAADPPPELLHPIRLASKRLRYTLELFRECYGPGLETRLVVLQRLQKVLGEVNDCAAAIRLILEIAPDSPARRRGEQFLRRRAEAKAAELRKEWHEVFDAPGRERWWVAYLAK